MPPPPTPTTTADRKAIAVRLTPDKRAAFEAFRDRHHPGRPLAVLARELVLAAVDEPPPPAAAPVPPAAAGLSKAQTVFLATLLSTETAAEVADLYARVVEGREGPVAP